MPRLLTTLRAILRELWRRKVTGVVIAYVVAAGGAIQLADIVAPRFGLPDETVRLLIILAMAGLPVAALLAWLYELVPDPAGPGLPPDPEPAEEADAAAPRAPLPTAATPFIGRAAELRDLCALLTDPATRLVTVTGTGGVGKTRLAQQAAHRLATSFRDGVVYRPLSSLASPELLLPALAESLGVPLARQEDPLSQLQSFLAGRELLLVLDNFEQLTDAAALLAQLIEHAPGVRMVVTSRERLNLPLETLLTLEGLPVGDDAESDAVQLFVTGARRVQRDFELNAANRADVARICTLLGGIPLAVELASAWVRTLSCAEIRAELESGLDVLTGSSRDPDVRHRSLRATFDSSWRLLSSEEQSALARLAVFRSTFERAAAGEVADADATLLRQLVDKSLLTRADQRLFMLEVVRAYALERLALDPAGERLAREQHLAWFVRVLESEQARVQRADPAAIARIGEAIDELRAAWRYAADTRDTDALLRGMDGLFHFYEARGWVREGAEVFARAAAAFRDPAAPPDSARPVRLAVARLDLRHGVFASRLGDFDAAEALLRRATTVVRELDENAEVVMALNRLGFVRHGMGDYDAADRLHQEAWALARELRDQLAVGWSMTLLGNVAWSRGEFERATSLYTHAMELLRAERDLNGMWVTLHNLGVLAASRRQYDEAQRRFREALALQGELNNPRNEANALHNLGCAARDGGDLVQARQWLERSLEISARLGYRGLAGFTSVALAEVAIREDDLEAAGEALQRALRSARAARNHPLVLEALLTCARLRLRQHDTASAAEIARMIGGHPGATRDMGQAAAELLAEIGEEAPEPRAVPDLDTFIDGILEEDAIPASTGAAARLRSIMHAQAPGGP